MLVKSIKLSEGQKVEEKETGTIFTVLSRSGQDHTLASKEKIVVINQRKLKLFFSIL